MLTPPHLSGCPRQVHVPQHGTFALSHEHPFERHFDDLHLHETVLPISGFAFLVIRIGTSLPFTMFLPNSVAGGSARLHR